MKILRSLIYVLIGIFLIITILIKFSTVTSTYVCINDDYSGKESESEKFFMKLEIYRWWVLWGESDGIVWVVTTDNIIDYYSDISIDSIKVYINKGDNNIGDFNRISKRLYLHDTLIQFRGYCKAN